MSFDSRLWTVFLLASGMFLATITATMAEQSKMPLVRIAELEIDRSLLPEYKAAVQEEIRDAVQHEPGVLAIYWVTVKDHPASFRLMEIYADEAAYKAHLAGPYFQKYAERTKGLIVAKRLIETDPVQSRAKQ